MPASPATPKAVPPPITPVTTQQATSEPSPPSPRALNVSPGKPGCESVSVSIPTHQGTMGKSKEDSAPISSKLDDFEKTLQDLDRDIHGFEKVAEDHLVANDSTTFLHQGQSAQSALFLGPTMGPPLVQLNKPIPLNDQSNMDLDHSNVKSQAEGKWLRIQRPTYSKEINNSEAILGKRPPLIPLESSTPTKRKARACAT
nr:hypothetical protein CFP56_48376 [Quercus suber]